MWILMLLNQEHNAITYRFLSKQKIFIKNYNKLKCFIRGKHGGES